MDINEFVGGNAVYLSIAAFIILCIWLGVRIVPQSEKHVVERFGRLRSGCGWCRWWWFYDFLCALHSQI